MSQMLRVVRLARWTQFGRLLGLASTTALLLGGCFLSEPGLNGATGVRLSNGDIVVRVHACREPRLISGVELNLSGKPDDILWRIEAPEGVRRDHFTIGETPPAFALATALREAPKPGTNYYIDADQPNRLLGVLGVTFDPAELRTDRWLVDRVGNNREFLTDEEFDRLDPC